MTRSIPHFTIPVEIAHRLVSVVASHLDISASLDSRATVPCSIDLQARLSHLSEETLYPMRTHLDMRQPHVVAIGAGPIYGSRMSLSICHGPGNHQGRPFLSRRIAIGRDLLTQGSED